MLSAATLLMLATSCEPSKTCKCYIYNGAETPYVQLEYISTGSSCSGLDYERGNSYKKCLEYDEADIDPNDIAQGYK